MAIKDRLQMEADYAHVHLTVFLPFYFIKCLSDVASRNVRGLQYMCLFSVEKAISVTATISVIGINVDATQAVDWKIYITVAFLCYITFLTEFTSSWGVNTCV